MNNLKLAYRNLLRQKQNSFIKILSLGTGLAVGLVLLSKISFEQHYDDFYPDNERIYRIETSVVRDDKQNEYGRVSGAIAPGIKQEVPGVTAATRFTGFNWDGDGSFSTQDKNRYKGYIIMADEYFFDIFPRRMIAGNAKETLSRSLYALVSHSVAKKMGGNPIGKSIRLDAHADKEIIIGGIFEDIPENSYNRYDVIVSLKSISHFMPDGSDNWLGNDRYHGYVKLDPGILPESLYPAIHEMQEKHQDLEGMREAGVDLTYTLRSLTSLHSDSKEVKNITLILSIIAFALMLTTLLNYLLIVITGYAQRSKEFAVNKCYGAAQWHIIRSISADTAMTFLLSLGLGTLLLFFFKSTIEEVMGASLIALFSLKAIFLMLTVLATIFIFSVYIPTRILIKTSLAAALRKDKSVRQRWKLILLFVQFGAAAFLVTLTATISKQYNNMIIDHPGYDYDNIIYIEIPGVESNRKITLANTLKDLPEVELTSICSSLPIYHMSGNNIRIDGDQRDLFNIAEMYYVDENFMPMLNIPIVEGRNFDDEDNLLSALVSESFKTKMKTMLGWEEVVGRDVFVTEHMGYGPSHIVGMFPDIRIGSFGGQDTRPAVIHYSDNIPEIMYYYQNYLLVKLRKLNAENKEAVEKAAQQILPELDISFTPYADSVINSYGKERLFRDTIMIGAIITLVISLIGLIGYIKNEIDYRTAEIAIRKINGATLTDILRLFVKSISYIALPAIVAGCITSNFVSIKWMENFSQQWRYTYGEYLVTLLLLFILIEATVVLNCIKTANQNPAESLKKRID